MHPVIQKPKQLLQEFLSVKEAEGLSEQAIALFDKIYLIFQKNQISISKFLMCALHHPTWLHCHVQEITDAILFASPRQRDKICTIARENRVALVAFKHLLLWRCPWISLALNKLETPFMTTFLTLTSSDRIQIPSALTIEELLRLRELGGNISEVVEACNEAISQRITSENCLEYLDLFCLELKQTIAQKITSWNIGIELTYHSIDECHVHVQNNNPLSLNENQIVLLKYLCMYTTKLTVSDPSAFKELSENAHQLNWPKLRELDLKAHNDLTPEQLVKWLALSSSLQVLHIGKQSTILASLFPQINPCPTLSTLELYDTTDDAAETAPSYFSTIFLKDYKTDSENTFDECRVIKTKKRDYLLDLRGNHRKILSLHLPFNHPPVSPMLIRELAVYCPNLTSLQIPSANTVDAATWRLLFQSCSKLEEFELFESNCFNDSVLLDLATLCLNLKKLTIYKNKISSQGLKKTAKKLSKLENLNLWNCQNFNKELLTILGRHKKLKSLHLNGCPAVNDVFIHQLIANLSHLNTFEFCHCTEVTSYGVEELIHADHITDIIFLGCTKISTEDLKHLSVLDHQNKLAALPALRL